MPGKNQILEAGSVLFSEGDQSDGMYVVRKGKLLIYLDKGGNEIPLATVGEGAMVGEMALFDKKPRSASARAEEDCEVSIISNADFAKIMKQIPNWFVTLMATLSSRLRDTNLRLEEMEAQYKGNVNPIEEMKKTLMIINLLWHKIGSKEVKTWSMERDVAEQEIAEIIGQPPERVHGVCTKLVEGGLLGTDKNSYNKEVFTIQNRGSVERLVNFVSAVRKTDSRLKEFPQEMVDMIQVMLRLAKQSAYEAISISFEDIESEGETLNLRVEDWDKHLHLFDDLDEAIDISRTGDGELAYKINKKLIPKLLNHAKLLRTLTAPEKKKKPKRKKKPQAA